MNKGHRQLRSLSKATLKLLLAGWRSGGGTSNNGSFTFLIWKICMPDSL